jgi:hypothetical protein
VSFRLPVVCYSVLLFHRKSQADEGRSGFIDEVTGDEVSRDRSAWVSALTFGFYPLSLLDRFAARLNVLGKRELLYDLTRV